MDTALTYVVIHLRSRGIQIFRVASLSTQASPGQRYMHVLVVHNYQAIKFTYKTNKKASAWPRYGPSFSSGSGRNRSGGFWVLLPYNKATESEIRLKQSALRILSRSGL